MNTTLKLATAALIVLVGTGAAFAKTAWVIDDTRVKEDPHKWSDTLDWAYEGQKVNCIDFENGYCFAKRKGEDGWIDTDDLTFKKKKYKDVDVEFCIGGGGFGGGGFGYGEFCVEH
ncbi:MAG TPA: hypothetical protein GYA10_02140 [Alphaproteobacteria bacterium]|nr:hypothetical protein [Alphaproteobacteria bacterium]